MSATERIPLNGLSNRSHRRRLFAWQHGRCYYCGVAMTMQEHKPNTCTRDHIIPQSLGGSDDIGNLVGACLTCNNARGTMPADAFLVMVLFGSGKATKPLRTVTRRPATLPEILARMEIEIGEQVTIFARARIVNLGISWTNSRLPSIPFTKNGAATFTLAEVWPTMDINSAYGPQP